MNTSSVVPSKAFSISFKFDGSYCLYQTFHIYNVSQIQTFHTVVLREDTIDILSAFESILMRLLIAGSNELGHWLPPNHTWGHRGRGDQDLGTPVTRSWHT